MKVPQPSRADGPAAVWSGIRSDGRRRNFRRALLAWYRSEGRSLRIRSTRGPWPVLVAEVMSQQTQISRVDDVWVGFMTRFPTPAALAEAPTLDVLRAWQDLGYNRRAVALQRAARVMVETYDGRVPGSVAELEALPGVGPYTARAIAALAFGRPVAAVDTNVRRVIRRLLGAEPGPRELQAIADTLVAHTDPGAWTHAMMELGATICRAQRPACTSCPVRGWCASVDAVDGAIGPRRSSRMPFEQTTRWLRGRIVARLREQDDGAWTTLPGSVGGHGPERIDEAIAALQRDGLLERRADGRVRLPSSLP